MLAFNVGMLFIFLNVFCSFWFLFFLLRLVFLFHKCWRSKIFQIKLFILSWWFIFFFFFLFFCFLLLLLFFNIPISIRYRNFVIAGICSPRLIKWGQILILFRWFRSIWRLLSFRRFILRWWPIFIKISFQFVMIFLWINRKNNNVFIPFRWFCFLLSLSSFLFFLNNVFRFLLTSTIKYRSWTNSKFHGIQFRLNFCHITFH